MTKQLQYPRKLVTLVFTSALTYLFLELGIEVNEQLDEAIAVLVGSLVTYLVPEG